MPPTHAPTLSRSGCRRRRSCRASRAREDLVVRAWELSAGAASSVARWLPGRRGIRLPAAECDGRTQNEPAGPTLAGTAVTAQHLDNGRIPRPRPVGFRSRPDRVLVARLRARRHFEIRRYRMFANDEAAVVKSGCPVLPVHRSELRDPSVCFGARSKRPEEGGRAPARWGRGILNDVADALVRACRRLEGSRPRAYQGLVTDVTSSQSHST
jgi:hypothetical protein